MSSSQINSHAATTVLSAARTVVDTPAAGQGAPTLPLARLAENYKAIVKEQVIYYPVPFRLVRELGRGRQGIVFLGLRHGARGCMTRHAVKLFDPRIYPDVRHYWSDMGRIAAQTSRLQTVLSPNLVARDSYEEVNGVGYLQMEAIHGVDLRYLLDGRHLDAVRERVSPEEWARFTDVIFRVEDGRVSIQPGVALYIMRQVLRGLETLHDMGFVHSDVKPDNIMIDSLGYVKLVDFGRAVRIDEPMSILLGSPLYMAPETHRREPSTAHTDMYSVGLVGLEMMRGRLLTDQPDVTERELLELKMALSDRMSDLLPPHVRRNEDLVKLMRRFVEPDPERRYHSAEEAESIEGLRIVHRQLTQVGKDTEYGRELQDYLSYLLPTFSQQEASDLSAP